MTSWAAVGASAGSLGSPLGLLWAVLGSLGGSAGGLGLLLGPLGSRHMDAALGCRVVIVKLLNHVNLVYTIR